VIGPCSCRAQHPSDPFHNRVLDNMLAGIVLLGDLDRTQDASWSSQATPGAQPQIAFFYFQAFGSLVTLPAAGYHYNMDWTPCVGGTCTRWNGS
jgi:hypothetical protein